LSLRDNPEQQWVDLRQAVMDRSKSENKALMRRLEELEDSGAPLLVGMESGAGPEGELGPGE
jgi:mitotic spindle assembly checkpoint protein MAD1